MTFADKKVMQQAGLEIAHLLYLLQLLKKHMRSYHTINKSLDIKHRCVPNHP